jgi:DNA-binding XRE family transcriptional regulator
MTLTPSNAGDAHVRRARALARLRVSQLLEGSSLQIDEGASWLVITNPRRHEQGQVHVAYVDGSVCWERVTWEHWGRLEGFHRSAAEPEAVVGAARILGALAPDDIHYLNGNSAGFHAHDADSRGRPMPPAAGNAANTRQVNGFIGSLAEKLEALGLRVQPVNSALDFNAIAVTNPAASEWGTVHVGHDGLVRFWDSDAGTLDDASIAKILDHVTKVLGGSRPKKDRKEPAERWTIVDGDRLRQLRRKRRLTQQQLANRARVSRWTVGALERHGRRRCQNRTAELLAVALEVQLAILMCEDSESGYCQQNGRRGRVQPGGIS